jgi:hypothetical protein
MGYSEKKGSVRKGHLEKDLMLSFSGSIDEILKNAGKN